jgi:biopolymer transport protein ExbD
LLSKITNMATLTKENKVTTDKKRVTIKKAKAGSYEAVLEAVEFAKKTNLAKRYGA